MPILTAKLTSDTQADLPKRKDIPCSQEALAEYLGVKAQKLHMTQGMWRESNMLTDKGLTYTPTGSGGRNPAQGRQG